MSKGSKTKKTIMDASLSLAGELGLEGISIGSLAKITGLSKSGLFAHFNSKENLQLAILDYAAEDFTKQVMAPITQASRGIPRILILVYNWVKWSNNMTGGCIFSSGVNEFSERPGAVRDLLHNQQQQWLASMVRVGESAVRENHFIESADLDQFAFELYSYLLGLNLYRLILHDPQLNEKKEKALLALLSRYANPNINLNKYFKEL